MIYNSSLWISDLDETLGSLPILSELEGRSVMITGAAGLVCSAVVDLLMRYNETHTGKIHILAAGRWLSEMTDRFGDRVNDGNFTFVPYDASKTDNELSLPCDYIIHGASNAFPGMIVKEPVETMLSNFLGIKYLLDYAKSSGVRRVLYISSSEVYGQKNSSEPYREGEYGFIDQLNPRNSYSVGKRAAETMCASYADEYGVESVIVRPGHIYGPTASPFDNRVASAWSYAAAAGESIVMKSDGAQIRSYCYCLDCASAILYVLLRGRNIEAYNISNPESIVSIKEMAQLLALSGEVSLIRADATDDEKKGFNPMSNSSLDSAGLLGLGWKGLFDAQRGFSHTVRILKEAKSTGEKSK
ncbi:MAG: NAD(P)-dependent oxidoreductase [Oscillospiraceae bacterium]|nr:NAD(P)-dependent oxidoreductase [Oscillospiraceae bacterium]